MYIDIYIYIYISRVEWARTYPCAESAALTFNVLTFVGSMQPLFTGFVSVSVCCIRFQLAASGSELAETIRPPGRESGFDLAPTRLDSTGFDSRLDLPGLELTLLELM